MNVKIFFLCYKLLSFKIPSYICEQRGSMEIE